MANLHNRTRVVYVRVSNEEFERFRDLRQQCGARNMSDLVRSAVETMGRQRDASFESEVTHRLQLLETALERLHHKMELMASGRGA